MRALRQTVVVAFLAAGMLWAQNVGIGTTTPLTRLHVAAGDIFLGDATGADGFILHSRYATGYDFLQISTRTGGSFEWDKGITLVRSTGNVGIGTTAPGAKLDILQSSTGDLSRILRIGAGGSTLWSLGISDVWGTYFRIASEDLINNPPFVIHKISGNVGIGTTAPAERLHVEGNIRFSGALMPGGNAGTTGQVLVSQGAGNAPQWQDPSALTGFYKLLFVDAWNPSVNSNLGWSCSGCSGGAPYLTTCGTVRMLGGYGMCGNGCYFEKTFTGLPAHTEVMVEVFWWSVDSWDQHSGAGVDLVSLSIDGTEVSRATPYGPYPSSTAVRTSNASVCGNNAVDAGPQILVGWTAHTASSVTVRVTNLADQGSTDESMGIVMVRVWVK
jgi:hypothetical protein